MKSEKSQKKIVELFRTFFEKIVLPSVKNQPMVMEEWKYLVSMVSEDTIKNTEIDMYITMLNHEKTNKFPVETSGEKRGIGEDVEMDKYQRTSKGYYGNQELGAEKQAKQSKEEIKRKMLGALQAFHNSLVQNQQKLENDYGGGLGIKQLEQRKYH